MTAVLSNAINTFLESNRNGTLIELKRFLIEDDFRQEFLSSVEDPSIHYYWNNEYAMVRKGIAPLLTRIDTFLRPKVIRYMMAQHIGVDFSQCIRNNNIVLIKLSQGLIGEQNSFLLGSLFLSKLHQSALARQSLTHEQRHPFYVYCDEFQNYITPSIMSMLSSARKYGIGLILAHQELAQIDDAKTLNSIISNPYTRICFRLGANDAKRLESGFSFFEQSEFQRLSTGQGIMRVGSSQHDFNIHTFPLGSETSLLSKNKIIQATRTKYATPKDIIEKRLISLLPKITSKKKLQEIPQKPKIVEVQEEVKPPEVKISKEEKDDTVIEIKSLDKTQAPKINDDLEARKSKYLKQAEEQEIVRKHRSLQYYVRSMAQQRGFKSTIEESTLKGGKVDVSLLKDDIRIAIEISVTNRVDYEVQNIQKCLEDNYSLVYMISENEKHLKKIKEQTLKVVSKNCTQKFISLLLKNCTYILMHYNNQKQK